MKSSYEVRAQRFIMQIAPYVKDCVEEEDYEMAVNAIRQIMPNRRILCASGCARTAFITSDYVVKMEHDEGSVQWYGGCENEMRLYSYAEEDGMDYLFAKITPFDYDGKTYYIMPRIKGVRPWSGKWAWEYMTEEEQAWCRWHGLEDLHCGNFGFRNHQLCIIDYGCTD